jgi:broad specificity phosphatase PhoE
MLGYFETKNIGRKKERARAFHELGDTRSEVDMEFDWADETLHAEYGRRWMKELLARRGEDPESWPQILERCEQLVGQKLAEASDADREAIVTTANALLERAEVSATA